MAMEAAAAPRRATAVRARRSRLRSYLLLARVSNLPTVWSNALAGTVAAAGVGAAAGLPRSLPLVAVAASLFYTGGMFLNDAFDEAFDREHRPERPLPSGDITRGEATAIGAGALLLGEALLAPNPLAMALGLVLGGAILYYDRHHKGNAIAPVVMGLCRGLVYGIAAAVAGGLSTAIGVGAVLMVAYVAGLTVVAKRAGASARWLVPTLIAGISLLDAAFIGATSQAWALAALAACGFPLTLFLQRFVPGD
jgi:4-hydroxybenzoate polyprenyltransferase